MADYVLEGPKWGAGALGTGGGTVTWTLDASVPDAAANEIAAAFNDWARHADIQFQRSGSAGADILLRFAPIDGAGSVAGYADYSSKGSMFQSAAVTFDSQDAWHLSGGTVVNTNGARFFTVALHEIGHTLGLGHDSDAPAVMNPTVPYDLADLAQGDIDGIQALYGQPGANLFGATIHDATTTAGQVCALYDAIFDRAPDPLGLESWVAKLEGGTSLLDATATMLNSPEAQGRLGGVDDATFVTQLYETALHREGDAGGVQAYLDQLAGGRSRAEIVTEVALSAENVEGMRDLLDAGVFAPDAAACDIARLYHGILGRAPDAGGLAAYVERSKDGQSLHDIAESMVGSPEFAVVNGAGGDAGFVQGLYAVALGRTPEPGGLSGYLDRLSNGWSRADVALNIAESDEAHAHLLPLIEQGHALG